MSIMEKTKHKNSLSTLDTKRVMNYNIRKNKEIAYGN